MRSTKSEVTRIVVPMKLEAFLLHLTPMLVKKIQTVPDDTPKCVNGALEDRKFANRKTMVWENQSNSTNEEMGSLR